MNRKIAASAVTVRGGLIGPFCFKKMKLE